MPLQNVGLEPLMLSMKLRGVGVALGLGLMVSATRAEEPVWSPDYVGMAVSTSRFSVHGTATKSDGTSSGNATDEQASIDQEASSAGVYFGRRFAASESWTVGWEADLTQPGHRASFSKLLASGQPVSTLVYTMPWMATLRATVGRSTGEWFWFASAGAAVAQQDVERTQYQLNSGTGLTEARFTETDRATTWGYAWSAGAEWRWSRNVTVRAEYLSASFAPENFLFADARGGAQGAFTTVQGRIARNTTEYSQTRVGLHYVWGR